MTPKQADLIETIRKDRPSAIPLFERAYSGKSRSAGIKAHCLECCWLDVAAIRECQSSQCGVWPYRPYTKIRASNAQPQGETDFETDEQGEDGQE